MSTVGLDRLGTGAGLLAWGAVGLPVLAGDLLEPPVAAWWAAYLAYGLLLVLSVAGPADRRPRLRGVLLWLLIAAGVSAYLLDGGFGFSSVLLIVSAANAALLLPFAGTLAVVAGQTLTVAGGHLLYDHGPTGLLPVAEAGVMAGFQLFAVLMVEVGLRESRARAELAALNVELQAAQARLATTSRAAERLRIARDLHDLMGHQLTALAVNLEVASHLVDGPAVEHVERSRGLAKQLLADVRDVVGRLREPRTDLEAVLRAVVASVPYPAIHLSVQPADTPPDARHVEAVLRCVQEVVTNTVRHAHARNLWIEVSQSAEGIQVAARDDGRGSDRVRPGNGLTGMRERLEQDGGELTYRSARGDGFSLAARLPAT